MEIQNSIYKLRVGLNVLEKKEPSLFDGDDPHMRSQWEFWTTDEILEILYSDIEFVLKKGR